MGAGWLTKETAVTASPTSETESDLDDPPTSHSRLLGWVRETAELTQPDRVEWCDGSDQEWDRLTTQLVAAGMFTRLERKPNSFWAASDPSDVARVEERTFICSRTERDCGPTNNWMHPDEMKKIMTGLYRGCMRGRTMYVVPFCMGPLDDPNPKLGVEITDSAYVVCSMKIMTRMGAAALRKFIRADGSEADFVPCLHSVGHPLDPGESDVPWPCNATKYISHFPEERLIWSYGSGYGGNALLGKKCYSLRIASVMARDEGWLAEHMLTLKLTSPRQAVHYIAAAFPSGCGKTNLAMLESTVPGWSVETLGDDIAWMRFGADGRLYAVNPENGFFAVAPGTSWQTNPNAMRTVNRGNSIFTNVGLTGNGDTWWEGMEDPPAHATSWTGQRWTPAGGAGGQRCAHPNSRYCTPMAQCPVIANEWDDPAGVPISAILFGGRRASTIPLVNEAFDWSHGVFLAATLSSEKTAAAAGSVGEVRRDPMAMLPFIGYHAGDYFQHWIDVGKGADAGKLPRIFFVNWFRRGDDGHFLWPGFGENSRVLKWIVERIEGRAAAADTPIGQVPHATHLDLSALDIALEDIAAALAVNVHEWQAELPLIEAWFTKIGNALPSTMRDELDALRSRLASPPHSAG